MAVDRDKILQAAQKLVEKKRYDKAVAEYQKLVADDPKDVRTLLKIGDLYFKLEQYVEAIATYERVGQFYSLQGFALKAIAVYKQIREIINKHVPHLEDRFGHIVPRLAEIYTQLGLTSDALAAYDEVATRFQRAGRDRDAIDIFRKIVDLDPSNPLPYLRLGEAFIRVRDIDNAIQRFGAAAEILLKLGRRDDALKVVERLLQHRTEARFARIAAEIYLERNEHADAMAALTKLQISFKEDPKDLETLALLARAFDALGQPPKAIEVQKEAARIAKEADKHEEYEALVDALVMRAPLDEGVRQLVAQRAAAAPAKAAALPVPPSERVPTPERHPSGDLELDEELVLDEDDVLPASDGPHSHGAIAAAQRFAAGATATRTVSVAPMKIVDAASAKPAAEPPAKPPPLSTRGQTPTGGSAKVDPVSLARQVIAQAEAHRRGQDFENAIGALIKGIEALPTSRDLREKLCDVLVEAGETDSAIQQMLAFAQWLGKTGDVDGAARLLDEVLLLEPDQADAIAMLRDLGYAVGAESYTSVPVMPVVQQGPPVSTTTPYDANAPLPSYDLEEMSATDALAHHGPRQPTLPPRAFGQLDDPFGGDGHGPASVATEDAQADAAAEQLDADALEEVEFFAQHGMFDEAGAMLDEQLTRFPNHPVLLAKRRELDVLAGGATVDESGTRAVPRGATIPPAEEQNFDIGASLDALDALEALDGGPSATQVSVDAFFEEFKAGVAAQISETDASTHYDLGVAYREMGLFQDAISEFDLASRDPARECVCQSMVGTTYLQMGDVEAAIESFIRGLHAKVKTRDQEIALTYEIGDAYESLNAVDQALYYFQRVARIEPGYGDMRGTPEARLHRLDPSPAKPAGRAAVGTDVVTEGFDEALDDLLGGGKLG